MKNFNELYSYRNSFKMVGIIATTIVISSFALVGIMYYYFASNQVESTTQIWVKTQDGSMFSAEKGTDIVLEDRIIEYKHHSKWFYTLWYSLNRANHQENINAALNLITTEQGTEMLDIYTAQGVFNKLQQTGRSFECKIDGDPEIKITSGGVYGKINGFLKFVDENGEVYRKQHLDIAFELQDVLKVQGRTNENPHGVIISSWEIINDSEVTNSEN